MATWIVSPVESSVLPDGNGLYVLFTILGLPAGFVPRSPEDSGGSSMVTTIGLDANWGRLVGWRFDETNREQFLLSPDNTERRIAIVRGRIVFIQPLSTAGDYAIRVLLELG